MRSPWLSMALGIANYVGMGWHTTVFSEEKYYILSKAAQNHFESLARSTALVGVAVSIVTIYLAGWHISRGTQPRWPSIVGLVMGILFAGIWLVDMAFPSYEF